MYYGTVKKIASERGFGFIERENALDVYFHASVVAEGKFDKMLEGQPVMYELAKRDRESTEPYKPHATVVKLIDRIPGAVLPRTPQELAPSHHPRARQRKPLWRDKGSGATTGDDASPRPSE